MSIWFIGASFRCGKYTNTKYVMSPLRWPLNCYIQEPCLHSDSWCLRVQGKPKLHRSRVPASVFSMVVVWTSIDFLRHHCGAVRWMCLVCTQRCVVTTKCLLISYVSSGRVQLSVGCNNPKCLSSNVGLYSTASDTHKGMRVSYVHPRERVI